MCDKSYEQRSMNPLYSLRFENGSGLIVDTTIPKIVLKKLTTYVYIITCVIFLVPNKNGRKVILNDVLLVCPEMKIC